MGKHQAQFPYQVLRPRPARDQILLLLLLLLLARHPARRQHLGLHLNRSRQRRLRVFCTSASFLRPPMRLPPCKPRAMQPGSISS